jgi:hypothetical protein
MNRNQLILLIVIGVVVGGIGLTLSRKQEASWKDASQRMGQKVLASFDVNAVETVEIRGGGGSLTLAKKDDAWGVAERGGYPANFGNIHDFLLKLMDLKVTQPVRAGGAQLARMELVAPDKGGTNSGTLITLKDKGGKAITSILLGKKNLKESGSSSPFGGGAWPNGRYVMVPGDESSVALVSEAFASAEPKPEEWLDKDFLKVEKLRSVAVTTAQATNSWKLSRETENGEWKMADAKPGENLDTGKTSSLNYLLTSASFHDVAPPGKKDEETGLDKPVVAKLATFDGFNYELKIGKADAESRYYVRVSASADIPKERTPGKDEKPEDKDKLEKEFKDKVTKAQEKLKREQFFGKWTYLVDKWSVDNLLKERREFMAEKKDDSKKDDAGKAVDLDAVPSLPGLPK